MKRVRERRPPHLGLAQEDRTKRQPRKQLQIVIELGRGVRERDRSMERLGAGSRVAAKNSSHPERGLRHEAGAHRSVIGQRGMRPFGRRQHLGRLARVEARRGGLGEHRYGTLWIGARRRRGQDLVPAHHRAAANRDVAGKLVDRHARSLIGRGRAGLLEQRTGTFGQTGVPRGLGCVQQEPGTPLVVGGQPRRPLERRRRGRVRAAIAAPDAGLLERGRRRVVRADSGRGQVPGAAIDVPVGQRSGERPVGIAPLLAEPAA